MTEPALAPAFSRQPRPALPALLGEAMRPLVLAREEVLSVASPFAELLGTPGLRRGSVVAVLAAGACGATSVALALLAQASTGGAWCAAVGMGDLGLVAAAELGVALDRLALVPRPERRAATVVAALLDGCDVVLAASSFSPADRRRLAVRARERRSVLVLVVGSKAAAPSSDRTTEGADVQIAVTKSAFVGLGPGTGRLGAQRIDVTATRRAASPRELSATLWFSSRGSEAGVEITLEGLAGDHDEELARAR